MRCAHTRVSFRDAFFEELQFRVARGGSSSITSFCSDPISLLQEEQPEDAWPQMQGWWPSAQYARDRQTWKLAPWLHKMFTLSWPFQLFYWDYSAGILFASLLFASSLGSFGDVGRGFAADLVQADAAHMGSALFGVAVVNQLGAKAPSFRSKLRPAGGCPLKIYHFL